MASTEIKDKYRHAMPLRPLYAKLNRGAMNVFASDTPQRREFESFCSVAKRKTLLSTILSPEGCKDTSGRQLVYNILAGKYKITPDEYDEVVKKAMLLTLQAESEIDELQRTARRTYQRQYRSNNRTPQSEKKLAMLEALKPHRGKFALTESRYKTPDLSEGVNIMAKGSKCPEVGEFKDFISQPGRRLLGYLLVSESHSPATAEKMTVIIAHGRKCITRRQWDQCVKPAMNLYREIEREVQAKLNSTKA